MRKSLALFLVLMLIGTLCTGIGVVAAADGEPTPLTFVAPQKVSITDWNDNGLTRWIEEQANVEITFETIPSSSQAEQVALMLVSGDLPDAFWGCDTGIPSSMLVQYGVDDESFIQLDELIPDCPNIVAAFDEMNVWGQIRQMDGHIYHIPQINVCQHCRTSSKMWYNGVWAENLGIEAPTTIDEFYNMLVAFKNDDPNGNGENDEIPFAGATVEGWRSEPTSFLLNAYTYFDYDNRGFRVTDGAIDNAVTDEAFREGIIFLNKLASEELLYLPSFSMTTDDLKKLTEAENGTLVGAIQGGFCGVFANLGSDNANQYRCLYPLTGPDGYVGCVSYPYFASSSGTFVITSNCADPAAAMRVVNATYSFEGSLDCSMNLKGEYWDYATEGLIGFNGEPALWTALKPYDASIPTSNGYDQSGPYYFSEQIRSGQSTDTSVDLWSADGNEYMLYKVTAEGYDPVRDDSRAYPPLSLSVDESETVTTLRVEWDKFFQQAIYELISGARNPNDDNEWNNFLAECESCGLNEILEIYTTAYQRQYTAE